MAHWLRDKLFAGQPFDGSARRSRHYWLWSCSVGFACMIALAVFFHGCEQRQLIRPTPQMETDSQFWVRVLLAADVTECSIEAPSALNVLQGSMGPTIQATGYTLEPAHHPTKVTLSNGRLILGDLALPGNRIILSPQSPFVFTLNADQFRGKVQLVVDSLGRTFDVINLIPLEPYLAGVVGEEMPDYWEPEALKAQAIAARTYCLYVKNRFGPGRNWDVSRTQANQVYGGIQAESSSVWNAVNGTFGKIVVSAGRPAGSHFGPDVLSRALFPAYYSSVCGGHTANSEDIFGESYAALKGVACPYCKDVAKLGMFYWPTAQFDRATVTRQLAQRYPKLEALGQIKDITVLAQQDYGEFSRLTRIRLTGETGKTDTLRGEDLRLAIDPSGRKIKSMICHVVPWGDGWAFLSGRGWGHGAGMCQCGAEGLARSGSKVDQILQYYYPGCEVVSVY
jgi:stage II sporulation protein D